MPQITTDGQTFEAEEGRRLVKALEDAGTDVSHRCGGYARCTTCRVSFTSGEPEEMTRAEFDKLGDERGEYRLSCQITCTRDMELTVLMPASEMGFDGPGPEPEDVVTPQTATYPVSELEDA